MGLWINNDVEFGGENKRIINRRSGVVKNQRKKGHKGRFDNHQRFLSTSSVKLCFKFLRFNYKSWFFIALSVTFNILSINNHQNHDTIYKHALKRQIRPMNIINLNSNYHSYLHQRLAFYTSRHLPLFKFPGCLKWCHTWSWIFLSRLPSFTTRMNGRERIQEEISALFKKWLKARWLH